MTAHQPSPVSFDIGIVGAGRVGAVLGAALRRAGHRILGVSAVSDASRERAARLLPGIPVLEVHDVVRQSNVVVLAVPDDALEPLVAGLVATGAVRPGQVLVHTSGAHGIGVFDAAAPLGIVPLALHPAMTFTGTTLDLDRLPECRFGVTAPRSAEPIAQALVMELGAEPVWVEEEDRATYHCALAHGSNHLVTLVSQAMSLLRDAGVQEPARLLEPLLSAALANTLQSADAALTGPVSRGDVGTVAGHLDVLGEASDPDVLPAYRAMALATAQRAQRTGRLRADLAAPMTELLGRATSPDPDEETP